MPSEWHTLPVKALHLASWDQLAVNSATAGVQPYSVFIYCTSDGATQGQVAPTKSHLGHIEITRRKNVWRSSKAWEGEYFLISDDNYETTVKDDGEIKIERRY